MVQGVLEGKCLRVLQGSGASESIWTVMLEVFSRGVPIMPGGGMASELNFCPEMFLPKNLVTNSETPGVKIAVAI